MSARKRKLAAVVNAPTALPESLQYTPVPRAPIAPTPKKIRVAPPTPARMDVLAESAGLLQLQTNGLLDTLRPRQKQLDALAAAVKLAESVMRHVESISAEEPMKLDSLLRHAKKAKLSVPFVTLPPDDLQLNFEYKTPAIAVFNEVMTRHAPAVVRLQATIPAEVVQEKDYLNHRLLFKRAFYLYWIQAHLPSKFETRIEANKLSITRKGVCIELELGVTADSFAVSKLEGDKNADRAIEGPTPDYNQQILALQASFSSREHIKATSKRLTAFDDSLRLAHRFLSLRDLPFSLEDWSWATCRALEAKQKVPDAPLALFRATLQYLVSMPGVSGWDRLYTIRNDEMARLYLQHECKLVLDRLNAAGPDAYGIERAFGDIFLRRVANAGHFDASFLVPGQVDVAKLYRVVKRAAAGRVSLTHVRADAKGAYLGLLFDDETLVRSSMILGPTANTPEANQFRGFWGNQAELRKFKDGRILETVALDPADSLLSLLHKALQLHMQCSIQRLYYQLDSKAMADQAQLARTRAAAFDEIARLAREADDLPLRITSVSRTTSEYGPVDQLDGVIVFESSARWPDHVPAIQRTKIALLLSCQRHFAAIPGVAQCQVGLAAGKVTLANGESLSNVCFLSVRAESGCMYKLRVQFDREYTLLENESKKVQADKMRYVEAMRDFRVLYVLPTLHRSSIANVASDHPLFADTVRMLQKWIAAHLLARQFPQHLLELLAAHVFANRGGPFTEPKSLFAGFFRVMQFLAHWDWRQEIVIAETDATLTQAQRDAVQERFRQVRAGDPAMQSKGLLVYADYDLTTELQVDRVAALRMTQLARASFELLENSAADLFATPLEDFDIVFKLKQQKVYKNVQSELEASQLYMADLEACFGDAFLVFGGNGHAIGLMVRPELRDLTEAWRFKVNLGFNGMPVESKSTEEGSLQVRVNIQAMLDEMLRLGEGLIRDVSVQLELS